MTVCFIRHRRRTACMILVIGLLASMVFRSVPGHATATNPEVPGWAKPTATTMERVSPTETSQTTPVMFSNTDCSLVTYHLTTSSTMQTGCFTETAFGLMDSDSGTIIFNGTDEGVRVLKYGNWDTLLPWPGALNLVVITPQVTNGSAVSMYRNPLPVMSDHRDTLGRIDYKQLTQPPELPLNDIDGKRLIINPQTFAYSANGAWAIAESINGWFVRINLASLDVTRFAPSYTAAGVSGALPSYDAVSRDGHYVAIANAAADVVRVYDLTNCTSTPCPSFDYKPSIRQKVPGLTSITHVRFINDSVLTFQARGADSVSSGIYVMAPAVSIPHLTEYIGLGDSYTSGEGAFDYLAGTDTSDDVCHLSRNSYPLLLSHDLFSASGGHSVACSGAVVNDVGNTSQEYRGQVRNGFTLKDLEQNQSDLLTSVKTNYIPGYIAQHLFIRDKMPAVATVSVGGDDIGFGDLVETCVAPHLSRHQSDSTCFNTYEDRRELTNSIDRMVPRWAALYRQLLSDSPGVRLYAIGYPQIVDDTGNCAANVHLSKSELEFSMEIIDYLNTQISQAAKTAGITYVDVGQALKGHRLCEAPSSDVAVNGLTAGKDAGILGFKVFGHESYHPNALGQELIEQAIISATNHLTSGGSQPVSASAPSPILDAPKSGRVINTVVRASLTSQQSVVTGQSIAIHIPGPAYGVPANSTFEIRVGGVNTPPIGQLMSGTDGTLDGEVRIPASALSGDQPLDITGHASDGLPLDITQPIQIRNDTGDEDGDGIPDSSDTCVFAVNSNQDTDRDGIDDSCDDYIGAPPPSSPSGGDSNQPPASSGGSAEATSVVTSVTSDTSQTLQPNSDSFISQQLSSSSLLQQAPETSTDSPNVLSIPAVVVAAAPISPTASLPARAAPLHSIVLDSSLTKPLSKTHRLPAMGLKAAVSIKNVPFRTDSKPTKRDYLFLLSWIFLLLGYLLRRTVTRKRRLILVQ